MKTCDCSQDGTELRVNSDTGEALMLCNDHALLHDLGQVGFDVYDYQYVDYDFCSNCSGVKCMGCVFREYDHECVDDCPMCCPEIMPQPCQPTINMLVAEQHSLYEVVRGLRTKLANWLRPSD